MNLYRCRRRDRPWWRTRAAGLITAACGYLLFIVAMCGLAASMLK